MLSSSSARHTRVPPHTCSTVPWHSCKLRLPAALPRHQDTPAALHQHQQPRCIQRHALLALGVQQQPKRAGWPAQLLLACALTLTHAGCAAGQLRGAAAAYLPEEHAAAARHAETAVAPTTRTHSHLLAPACHASHNCFLACTSIARAWASTSTSLPLPCRPCTSRTSKPVHVCSCNLLGHLEARTHSTFLQCLISACRQAGRSHISGHWTGGCAPAM